MRTHEKQPKTKQKKPRRPGVVEAIVEPLDLHDEASFEVTVQTRDHLGLGVLR